MSNPKSETIENLECATMRYQFLRNIIFKERMEKLFLQNEWY